MEEQVAKKRKVKTIFLIAFFGIAFYYLLSHLYFDRIFVGDGKATIHSIVSFKFPWKIAIFTWIVFLYFDYKYDVLKIANRKISKFFKFIETSFIALLFSFFIYFYTSIHYNFIFRDKEVITIEGTLGKQFNKYNSDRIYLHGTDGKVYNLSAQKYKHILDRNITIQLRKGKISGYYITK